MANYTTSADIIDDVLFRAGEPTDDTSDFQAAAVRYVNRAYQGIWSGGSELDPSINEVWWWLRKDDQGVLTLDPIINAGTIAVTNNSTTITFSSAPTASMTGRHFKVDDHADVFIITAHTADETTATIDSVYTGDTNASASYKVVHLDYTLASDVLYLSMSMFGYQSDRHEVKGISLLQLREKWPLNVVAAGVPQNFAMLSDQSVRFSHYGGRSATELIRLDYEYIREPSDLADDTNTPAVPRQYRKIIADWALAFLLADKNDTRAADAARIAGFGITAMAKENRRRLSIMNRDYARVHPRQQQLERFERPLRTESGLIIG